MSKITTSFVVVILNVFLHLVENWTDQWFIANQTGKIEFSRLFRTFASPPDCNFLLALMHAEFTDPHSTENFVRKGQDR